MIFSLYLCRTVVAAQVSLTSGLLDVFQPLFSLPGPGFMNVRPPGGSYSLPTWSPALPSVLCVALAAAGALLVWELLQARLGSLISLL